MTTDLYHSLGEDRKSFGEDRDCGVVALTVATGESYSDCHTALSLAGRQDRQGTYNHMYKIAADLLGYHVTEHYRFNCEFHSRLDWMNYCKTPISAERHLPSTGGFIFRTRNHAIGARDGQVHDWTKGRRHRILSIMEVIKLEA